MSSFSGVVLPRSETSQTFGARHILSIVFLRTVFRIRGETFPEPGVWTNDIGHAQHCSEHISQVVLKNLEEFIHDVLYQELKPTKKLLVMASRAAYEDLSGKEAILLAESVLKAVTFCRVKSKSMKSGVKLLPAVVSTILVILGSSRLGGQLREGASKVMKGQPGESSASKLCLPELPCVSEPAVADETPKKPARAQTVEELCAIFGVTPPAPSGAPDCIMDLPDEECVDLQSSPEHPDHTVQSHRSWPAASSWEPSPGFQQDAAASFNKVFGEMEEEKKEKNAKKEGDNKEKGVNQADKDGNSYLVFMDASVPCLCKMTA